MIKLTTEQLDALAIAKVSPKLFKEESSLYATKWWDYRGMHPVEATYEFAKEYIVAYRRVMKRRVEQEVAARLYPVKGTKDIFVDAEKIQLTGFWKARQMADRIGCPYSFYCSEALLYGDKRDWAFLPKPTQLYSTERKFETDPSLVEAVEAAWQAKKADSVVYSSLSLFELANYNALRIQVEHQESIVRQIQCKKHKQHLLLAQFVFTKPMISYERAVEAFGTEVVEHSKRYAIGD